MLENYNQSVYVALEQKMPIDITGCDSFVFFNIHIPDNNVTEKICDIVKSDKIYTLAKYTTNDQCDLFLMGENNRELIRFSTREIFDKFYNYSSGKGSISAEEATFSKENDLAKVTIVVQNLNIDKSPDRAFYGADVYAFIKIK